MQERNFYLCTLSKIVLNDECLCVCASVRLCVRLSHFDPDRPCADPTVRRERNGLNGLRRVRVEIQRRVSRWRRSVKTKIPVHKNQKAIRRCENPVFLENPFWKILSGKSFLSGNFVLENAFFLEIPFWKFPFRKFLSGKFSFVVGGQEETQEKIRKKKLEKLTEIKAKHLNK